MGEFVNILSLLIDAFGLCDRYCLFNGRGQSQKQKYNDKLIPICTILNQRCLIITKYSQTWQYNVSHLSGHFPFFEIPVYNRNLLELSVSVTLNTIICDLQARADMGFVSTFTGQWSDLELLIQAAPRETVETDIYAGKVGARVWTKALTQLSQGDIQDA